APAVDVREPVQVLRLPAGDPLGDDGADALIGSRRPDRLLPSHGEPDDGDPTGVDVGPPGDGGYGGRAVGLAVPPPVLPAAGAAAVPAGVERQDGEPTLVEHGQVVDDRVAG